MDTSKIAAHLDRVDRIFTLREQELAKIDSGLRADVLAERKKKVDDEFVNNPEGLHKQRIPLRANIAALRAERAKVADPQAALLRAAWTKAGDLTPGHALLLESAKTASPVLLAQMVDLAAHNPVAVAALGHRIQERKDELVASDDYAGLHSKVQTLAGQWVDHGHVRQLAALEHRALVLEHRAMAEVDGADVERRLTLAREIEAVALVVAEHE